MDDLSRVTEWIEAGKQVGKSALFNEADKIYWVSIGVQKWEGEYKLYFFKVDEARMKDLDYYDVEGTMRITHFEGLSSLISALCPIKISELTPQKGNKIFNPAFN
ncbi:MAG: hypothetical protein ACRYFR_00150 [Janthinobacterium lividum]